MDTYQVTYVIYLPGCDGYPYGTSFDNKVAKAMYLFLTTGKPDLSSAFELEDKKLFEEFKKTEIEYKEHEDLKFYHMGIPEYTYEVIAASIED